MQNSWDRVSRAAPYLKKHKKKKKSRAKQDQAVASKRATKKGNVSINPFYSSPEWKALRYEVLKLRGAKCECCGRSAADGAQMNVDHIKPRSQFPTLALDITNMQVLCAWCNEGKGHRDMTDWRQW